MAQERRFEGEAHAGDCFAVLPDFEDYFDHVIHVALGVDASWDGETDQVHLGSMVEHQRADFYGADSDFKVEFSSERYARD